MESFYNCEYRLFFEAFAEILEAINKDIYLKDHVGYYAKEMRLVAYRQYLESFKSVTIENIGSRCNAIILFNLYVLKSLQLIIPI